MPKDEKGYGSNPRSLNVTDGYAAQRAHDFYEHKKKNAGTPNYVAGHYSDQADDLLNKAKRGKHGGLAAGELERMRQEIRKRGG